MYDKGYWTMHSVTHPLLKCKNLLGQTNGVDLSNRWVTLCIVQWPLVYIFKFNYYVVTISFLFFFSNWTSMKEKTKEHKGKCMKNQFDLSYIDTNSKNFVLLLNFFLSSYFSVPTISLSIFLCETWDMMN